MPMSPDNQAARRYLDMCLDFGKAHGYGPKAYPVLSRRTNPVEWEQWRAYYAHHRLSVQLQHMAERSEHTVPALSPYDFDPDYRQPSMTLRDRRVSD